MEKIAVLGAGSWGTALSLVLADNNYHVNLWTYKEEQKNEINQYHRNNRYLQVSLPETIVAYTDLEAAIRDVKAIIMVVPTKAIREVTRNLNSFVNPKQTIIHASKGIEPGTLKRVSQMIAEELDRYEYDDIVVLSGPSHAEDVALRHPTTVTVASLNEEKAKIAQDLFTNDSFRVYTSSDVLGVELGGALKNIIALGAGISDILE